MEALLALIFSPWLLGYLAFRLVLEAVTPQLLVREADEVFCYRPRM